MANPAMARIQIHMRRRFLRSKTGRRKSRGKSEGRLDSDSSDGNNVDQRGSGILGVFFHVSVEAESMCW
jgi:hypothetical protein